MQETSGVPRATGRRDRRQGVHHKLDESHGLAQRRPRPRRGCAGRWNSTGAAGKVPQIASIWPIEGVSLQAAQTEPTDGARTMTTTAEEKRPLMQRLGLFAALILFAALVYALWSPRAGGYIFVATISFFGALSHLNLMFGRIPFVDIWFASAITWGVLCVFWLRLIGNPLPLTLAMIASLWAMYLTVLHAKEFALLLHRPPPPSFLFGEPIGIMLAWAITTFYLETDGLRWF